jgi:hypothetical protein
MVDTFLDTMGEHSVSDPLVCVSPMIRGTDDCSLPYWPPQLRPSSGSGYGGALVQCMSSLLSEAPRVVWRGLH